MDLKVIWGIIAIILGLGILGYGLYEITHIPNNYADWAISRDRTIYGGIILLGVVVCVIGSKFAGKKQA